MTTSLSTIDLSDVVIPFGPVPAGQITSPAFLRASGHATRCLPGKLHDPLVDFTDSSSQAGALLIRGLPVGQLPPTPERPTSVSAKDMWTEYLLLTIARRLGQPVGYLPEHGGDIVQNIVPTKGSAARQTSTSSGVELLFHTEAAFHPHRPRFLLLLCLRGDRNAATTLASVHDAVATLPASIVATLREPRFRTAPDASFRREAVTAAPLGPELAVISGSDTTPTLVFDEDLMVGTDTEAAAALEQLAGALKATHRSVVLAPGDLLVVDNFTAVHGRTPFTPRFDGTDRWLQRSFVVSDLAPSAAERIGRIITSTFD